MEQTLCSTRVVPATTSHCGVVSAWVRTTTLLEARYSAAAVQGLCNEEKRVSIAAALLCQVGHSRHLALQPVKIVRLSGHPDGNVLAELTPREGWRNQQHCLVPDRLPSVPQEDLF